MGGEFADYTRNSFRLGIELIGGRVFRSIVKDVKEAALDVRSCFFASDFTR